MGDSGKYGPWMYCEAPALNATSRPRGQVAEQQVAHTTFHLLQPLKKSPVVLGSCKAKKGEKCNKHIFSSAPGSYAKSSKWDLSESKAPLGLPRVGARPRHPRGSVCPGARPGLLGPAPPGWSAAAAGQRPDLRRSFERSCPSGRTG